MIFFERNLSWEMKKNKGKGNKPDLVYLYNISHYIKTSLRNKKSLTKAWEEIHLVSALQGLVNRKKPQLYISAIKNPETGNINIDKYWLTYLRRKGNWLSNTRIKRVNSLTKLIQIFRRYIKGLVVYDLKIYATSNVASTVAGVEKLLPVPYRKEKDSLYQILINSPLNLKVKIRLIDEKGHSLFTGKGKIPGTNIKSTGNAKCDAYIWAKTKYLDTGLCNCTKLGYYIDSYWINVAYRHNKCFWNHTLTNHDYFIAQKGFFFDLSPWDDETPVDSPKQRKDVELNTLKAILHSANRQTKNNKMIHIGGFVPWAYKYTKSSFGKHNDVESEWRFVKIISAFNAFLDADAIGMSAMANASFYQHFPLKKHYPQKINVTINSLKKKGYIDKNGNIVPKHYFVLYVGDYDSAAWLYQLIPTRWRDSNRGKLPLSWAFNPNLEDRSPHIMDYIRKTAKKNDFFIAGDSGAGYINPGMLEKPREFSGLPSGLKVWEKHCAKIYKRWSITITGFGLDGLAPPVNGKILDAYSRFSKNGYVGYKISEMGVHKEMPYVKITGDIDHSAEKAAKKLVDEIGNSTPNFKYFRSSAKTPLWYVQIMKVLKTKYRAFPLELVDPYTFFALIKYYHKKKI